MPEARKFVGKFLTYPDRTGKRQAEGGRRLNGELRQSLADTSLVTVITVCWNSASTIEQTIRSVLAQSYRNIEHIVVDGNSNDATLDILRKYESDIDYFISEPDEGIYFAMNKGLELARGEYILILNSDDWYTPDCVETLVDAKRTQGADFVSGLAQYVDKDGKPTHLTRSVPFDAGVYLRMPLRHETMLLSSRIYNVAGPYDTRLFINADRELTKELFRLRYSHYEVRKPLMFFRNTGVSSTQMDKLRAERSDMLKSYFPGVSAEDIEALAYLEKLTPARVQSMLARYQDAIFQNALIAYGNARKARGDRLWKNTNVPAQSPVRAERDLPGSGASRRLNVATFSTYDDGGAGIGSQRRVQALRARAVNARIYCIFKNTKKLYVETVPLSSPVTDDNQSDVEVRKTWRERCIVSRRDYPTLRAGELFSKTGTLVDFGEFRPFFDGADIVHLHWVVGMFDYEHAPAHLGGKAVVWTLADMNAFTGGCHYSEGCTGYRNECRNCPLLGGDSDLAHKTWKIKKKAYAGMRNLHIVCPSQWLADRAAESSLFGDRPIHVIPNAFPINRFQPTNKMVARQQLGLPLDKKLVAFGADSLNNKRKGGSILRAAFGQLRSRRLLQNVEAVFFGSNKLDVGIKTHNMGHTSDERKLSLVYASADVFAFPSLEDNAPLTVPESLLSGTPVVAFPSGNVPQILAHLDTGYIARHHDVDDFAEGLAWALETSGSPEALKRSNRCHWTAQAYNDPGTAVRRHVNLYNEALGNSDRSAASDTEAIASRDYQLRDSVSKADAVTSGS